MFDIEEHKTSVIWSSKSSTYLLARPINFSEDHQYPGVPFRSTSVDGQTLVLHEHRNVEVLWWNYGLYVIDAYGVEIPELCYAIHEKPPVDGLRCSDPHTIEGVTASIMHWVPGNYSHILAEHLPLVQALSEANQLGRVDHILSDSWAAGFLKEVLALYNSNADIVGVERTGHVRIRTLLAFEPLLHPAHWGHEVMSRFFDKVRAAASPAKPHRRLIISRPAGRRGFTNQSHLAAGLPGFEVVSLDGPMSLIEQAKLFAEAELVVCGHGAAMNNLVFMLPGTAIVEIFNQDYGTAAFWILAGMRQVRYCACIDARGEAEYREAGKSDDIEADIDKVIEAIQIIDRSQSQNGAFTEPTTASNNLAT